MIITPELFSTDMGERGYYLKSKGDDYYTPADLLTELRNEFGPLFDPCPINHYMNGLETEWANVNFVNPPYSNWSDWVKKGAEQTLKGRTSIFLLPARTDTKTFHEYIYKKPNVEIRFIKGRLKFTRNGKSSPAPFPSMLVIMKPSESSL